LSGCCGCWLIDIGRPSRVLAELEQVFANLQIDGRKVIRDIYRKEQLYTGPCFDNAPDMVLVAAEGFNLKANAKAAQLADKGIFTGKHTQDTAFLLAKGCDENIIPAEPAVWDIKQIIETQASKRKM